MIPWMKIDETITVTLTNTDNIAYYQNDRTGTVTITDNDPEPDIEFEILSMDYNEGTDATTNTNVDVTVRIGNNATSGKDITATYTLTGKAKVPSDLKLASNAPGRTSDTTGIITIVAGQQSATIPLEIIADNYDEIDENFKITLSNVNNATIGTDIFTGTILDDDDSPVAAIMTNYSSFEDSGANDATGLVVTLTPASTKTVKVNYVFSDGSAVKNTNYSGTNGTLTFTPSQVTGLTPTTKFIPFSILDNSNQNASKTFRITLSIPSGGNARTMNPNNRAIVTIVDDESTPVISIVADSGDVAENAGPAMFKLTATRLTATTTLSINATPAEDGADFLTDEIAGTADNFNVEFRDDDGDDTYTGKLPIALQIDDDGEATGNIKLTLNVDPDPAKTYQLGTTTEGVITILDDDAPELEIRPVVDAVTEAIGAEARFRVSARVSPNEPVTIQYNVMEVVTNPGDLGLIASGEEGNKSKELDFSSNETSVEFAIPLMSDATSEDNSTLIVQMRDDTDQTPSGLTYTRSGTVFEANVQLVDDDSLPVISILADSGDMAENAGPAMFKLTATGLTATATLSINATPAEDGADFLTDEIAGTADDFNVEFRDDDGDDTYTGKLPIALQIDNDGEATGNIKLTLNVDPDPAKTYQLGTTTEGVITILDDDAPELEIRPVVDAVTEAIGAEARFRVSARVSPNEPVTIQYNVMEVVTNPGDLGLIASGQEGNKSKELDFRNDVTSIEFTIPLMSDTTSEDDSTLRVQLRDDTDQTASGLTYTRSGTVFEARHSIGR